MVFTVDIFGLFFCDFYINAAQLVNNGCKHFKADKHVIVNADFKIVFEGIHKQLCAAAALCGVQLVLAVTGNFQIHIP